MELTAAAQGLNEFFFGYDSALLGALHSAAEGIGVVMTPVMKLITLLGEKGLIFFLLFVGAVNTAWPRGVWYLDIGWKVKDAEPSEAALGWSRTVGVVLLVVAVVMMIV